ncbi:MAG TPA: tetratricopeptide repeat protein, partial [Vicinamibacterales bacterium]
MRTPRRRGVARALALVVVLAAAVGGFVWLRRPSIPLAGSAAHTQVVTAFYHGLAALEVGLLDDARDQFARATQLAPTEPAAWANLALAHLRRGDIESAGPAVERALILAPNRADVLLLAARLESARGGIEESVALLRRATAADPTDLRARFALVDELERAGQDAAGAEVLELLDDLVTRAPTNLAVIVERG